MRKRQRKKNLKKLNKKYNQHQKKLFQQHPSLIKQLQQQRFVRMNYAGCIIKVEEGTLPSDLHLRIGKSRYAGGTTNSDKKCPICVGGSHYESYMFQVQEGARGRVDLWVGKSKYAWFNTSELDNS